MTEREVQATEGVSASPPPAGAAPPPPARAELTVRAVLVSMLVAVLIGASYPLITLKLGFGPNISVVSAFFGYVFLSIIGFFTGKRAGKLENNLVQTAGTTAGQMGFMCVLLAAFDMLNASETAGFDLHLSIWQSFAWLTIAGLLGVLLAVPLRRHYIEEEKLAFAEGVAVAQTLEVLEDPAAARKRTRALGIGILMAAIQTWFQMGFPASIRKLPTEKFFGVWGEQMKAGFGVSLLSLGSGMLVGARIAVSMAIGMVLAWFVLPTPLVVMGAAKEQTFKAVLAWVMWPATGVMVAGGLTALALKWRLIAKTFATLRMSSIGTGGDDFPLKWVVYAVVPLTALLAVVQYVSLGIAAWVTLLALLLSIPLMLVGIRVLGETNWAPISSMANMMQGVFAFIVPGHVPTNMVASGMSGTIAGNGEYVMQDYKAGYLLGASSRRLTYIQLLSTPVGALAVSVVYPILRDRYGVVDMPGKPAGLSSPISVKWAGFAKLLSTGLSALPPASGWALLGGSLLGITLALAENRPEWKKYLPSPTGIGIGMLVPAVYMLPMVVGGLGQYVWKRARPENEEIYCTPLASGWIAGEALVAVALAIVASIALAIGVELG